MNKTNASIALVMMACGSLVSAQTSSPPAGTADSGESGYVGASTRIGLGYDDNTKLRGELYRVFSESDTSALLGEAWISNSAGGLKFSYNWLPEPVKGSADATVRKFFVAADRNTEGDAKVSVGGGMEKSNFFGGVYGSAAVTGRREVGDSTVSSIQTIQGDDGRPYLQDITTSVRTRIFERPYDYGVGARVGHFYEPALLRLTLGADYEWGRDAERQTTVSLGLEKFFYNAPYSLALNVEHYQKSGGFEAGSSDNRVMGMLRYEFGGPSFRPVKEYRMVEVPATRAPATAPPPAPRPPEPPAMPVVVPAPIPAPVAVAPPVPRKEKRLVKTTASMSADAFFEFDKTALTPAARTALDGVISRLKTSGFVGNLRLTGHTCNIGPAAYNLRLSERRALAVKNYLVANGGLQASVILAEGKGLTNPKFPNTRTERHKNRRVDLEFVTYEDKVEEITLPPEPAPVAAPPAPMPAPAPAVARPAAPAPVVPPAPVAAVEWRREVIDKEPTWVRRALRQSVPHKQAVDVYRQREEATSVTQGDKRYINRPPAAAADAYTVPFNAAGNLFDVLANDSDPDGDPLTITGVGAPRHGAAVVAGGKVSYTPATGFSGSDSFTYSIADGKGGTASATVSITVQGPPNRPPVAQNDAYTLDQNSTGNSLDVLANDSDPDGDGLAITSVGAPAHGTASIAGGKVNYTPAAGYTGTDAFTYSVADGKGGTANATVAITIRPLLVNYPPVAQNDAFTVAQNSGANSFNVLANDSDPDGDALTIASVSTPAHGSATIAGSRVNYTPASGYSGPDNFTYTIADGKGGTATATVTISITGPVAAPNLPPTAKNDAYTVDQNSNANSLDVLANDSDPDGDSLTITVVGNPAHGTASIVGGRISYTPAPGYAGSDAFTYTIADGRGGNASATVTIIVASPNNPPVARNDSYLISRLYTDLDVLANDSDPDGDSLTIIAVTQPPFGSVTISPDGRSLRYWMPFMFNQTTFTYTISDGRGGTAVAMVTLIDP